MINNFDFYLNSFERIIKQISYFFSLITSSLIIYESTILIKKIFSKTRIWELFLSYFSDKIYLKKLIFYVFVLLYVNFNIIIIF